MDILHQPHLKDNKLHFFTGYTMTRTVIHNSCSCSTHCHYPACAGGYVIGVDVYLYNVNVYTYVCNIIYVCYMYVCIYIYVTQKLTFSNTCGRLLVKFIDWFYYCIFQKYFPHRVNQGFSHMMRNLLYLSEG